MGVGVILHGGGGGGVEGEIERGRGVKGRGRERGEGWGEKLNSKTLRGHYHLEFEKAKNKNVFWSYLY